ncbi:autotransporter family protein [Bordetella avium]|uniref:autotransporter family protein n=1 Tax=Bordetella avium TaxID=521 RepID=UPI000E15BFB6|nr:autotransporter outer membrane beta-barrel domain-containing protein [Bordetella avium]WQE34143.1 autotransporter outer membrane beta-barrel domain-containing protein [Bordetella avium]SUV67727.1 autotransporter [Bordetella avium]
MMLSGADDQRLQFASPIIYTPALGAALILALTLSAPGQAAQVYANGTNEIAPATVDTGNISGTNGVGLYATRGGTINSTGAVQVTTGGTGAYGVHAYNNGSVTLQTGSTVTTTGSTAYGLYTLTNGRITATGTVISVAAKTYAVDATQGGKIVLIDSTVNSGGTGLFTLGANGDGTSITATNVHVRSEGAAVEVDRDSLISFTGGSVITTGASGHGLYNIGSGAELQASAATITTQGYNAHGVFAASGSMTLKNLTIETQGQTAYGAYAAGAVQVDLSGGRIHTAGKDSLGAVAQNHAQLQINDVSLVTDGDNSHGLLAFNSLANPGTKLSADKVSVTTSGANSHGAVLVGGAEMTITGGSSITAQGANAFALFAQARDGNKSVARVADSSLMSTQGVGVLVFGTTLDITLTRSQLSGQNAALDVRSASGNSGHLTLAADASTLTGRATLDALSTSELSLSKGSAWTLTGDSRITRLNNRDSSVQFQSISGPATDAASYRTLSTGHYTGQNGALRLNTYLAGDNSPSDKLIIDGGAADGQSRVRINNTGGPGAQTKGGILVIDAINGATTTTDAFALEGRAVAGPYEYRLLRGATDGSNAEAWYLRSEKINNQPDEPLYRPEVGAYLANQFFAQQFLTHTLDDRRGDQPTSPAQATQRLPHASWLRMTGAHAKGNTGDGNHSAKTDVFTLHGGADLYEQASADGQGKTYAGLMASYGVGSSRARADGNPYRANGRSQAWSLGAYGTWYGNDLTRLGPYVDTWAQIGTFRNRVEGQLLEKEKYQAHGWALSAETGYAAALSGRWVIEPQAQLIYLGYRQSGFTENTGVRIGSANADGLLTRLGARLYHQADTFQPYLAANWWRSSIEPTVRMDGKRIDNMYPQSRYELKTGLNARLAKSWTGWTSLSGNWGKQDYREYALRAGVQYTF